MMLIDLTVALISTIIGLLMLVGTLATYKPEDAPVFGIAFLLVYTGIRLTKKTRD